MITFLHTYLPIKIFFSLGFIHIYWYGFFLVLGMLSALAITIYLAKYYQVSRDTVFDLAFWLIIGGLIGARVYDIFLQLSDYLDSPWQIFKIWQGGLAIHGAIIAGLIITAIYARRHRINFWHLSALLVPGLALGQAIGRWGNYFNQELFGLPTKLAWGIPIDIVNRPIIYSQETYFQPTFLYESLGLLIIFSLLLIYNIYLHKKNSFSALTDVWSTALYMILYSILRFSLEFIRIDYAPNFLGLRWPQFISLIIIILASILLIFKYHASPKK